MKKSILIITFLAIVAMSCGSRTGKVGSVNSNDITYFKDKRTNLCFAIIGAKDALSLAESTSVGFSCVPCDSLKNVDVKYNN